MKLTALFPPAYLLFLLVFSGLALPALQAQDAAGDQIIGVWLVQDKDAQVRIYRAANGLYYGKVHWLQNPNDDNGNPRADVNNPDQALRSTPIMGKVIMKDFRYDPKSKEWVDGSIYQSQTGKTYTGYMVMNADGTLYMKGYVMGMRFLGKSNIWTRIN